MNINNELKLINNNSLNQLHKAGYTTLASIAASEHKELVSKIDLLSNRQAKQIINSAKVSLNMIFWLK